VTSYAAAAVLVIATMAPLEAQYADMVGNHLTSFFATTPTTG
jgi:hypothetical protein